MLYGKEALKLAQDTILAHNGNNKSSFTMKMLYQVEAELNEKDEKLTKYKRAFEILKDNCHISNYVVDGVNSGKKITFDVIREWYDKEEYELLEELMKDEEKL